MQKPLLYTFRRCPYASRARLAVHASGVDIEMREVGLKNKLHQRGRIAADNRADIVIFDPATVATGPPEIRADLPGGESRLFADAVGIERVMVEGVDIVVQLRMEKKMV